MAVTFTLNAQELESCGEDGLRVGIGGGSLCTTRVKTGFGVPNVSCLEDISSVETPIMDGGIRSSGDIVKESQSELSSVMLGSLINGTDGFSKVRLLKHPKVFIKDIEVRPH